MANSKLALGTVQFGLNYGINNKTGQVTKDEVFRILDYAAKNDITVIDTSYLYGESEQVIGEYLKQNKQDFKIISKVPSYPDRNPAELFEKSLTRLNTNKLYAYLVHHFNFYKENPHVWDTIQNLKQKRRVEKIGFSLYYPHEIEYLFDKNVEFDIVQIPYSIFDQRFTTLLPTLKEKNIEIHVRSVFLQGLVFKAPQELEEQFIKIKNKSETLHQLAQNLNISVSSLCLNFAVYNKFIDKIVIGVDSKKNLEENIAALDDKDKIQTVYPELLALKEDDENIILPFNWK